MDFRSTNIINFCHRPENGVKYTASTISASSSQTSTNNVQQNKRKRRATLDDKDTDYERPSKRAQISCYQSESQPSSNASSYSSPVDELSHDLVTISDTHSSSDCLSTVAEYDLGTPSSPTSPADDVTSPSSYHSNSCASWHTRGDITPHSNKTKTKKSFDDYVSQCCDTPTADIRLCPLPALSWANASDVWNLMCRKDERAAFDRESTMLEHHPGLQPRMRAILLDWLIEVCEVYKLHRETYYLAVDYLDRYLSTQKKVQKTHLQLIGITCLFIAAKVEEIYPPKIGEFAYVTDGACQEEDILQHELLLLQALDWKISPVTAMGWLGVYMQLNVSNRTPSTLTSKYNKKRQIQPQSEQQSLPSNSSTCSYSTKNSQDRNYIKENKTPSKNNQTSFNISANKNNNSNNNNNNGASSEKISSSNLECKSSNSPSTADDSGLSVTLVPENDDAFIYPQFSGFEFVQTAQLIDLCSLDLGMANFPYSIIAAAAISHTFNRETALRVSGLEWNAVAPCARWMEPFFHIVCEESQHLQLLEHNEQVKTTYGLGHFCPNIVTDDSHIIQTHTISMAMFDRVALRREQYTTAAKIIQQEASPAIDHVCPEGLLTPPSSSRKPLDDDNVDNDSDLKLVKTS